MEMTEKIIDLKAEKQFLEQYIMLRNSYADYLLTTAVDIAGTTEWLKSKDFEIRCIIDNNTLLGAVILYLNRNGEVAFFAREKGKGIGVKLLYIIEEVAKEHNLQFIWAWVLEHNVPAQRAFEKAGFIKIGSSNREFAGKIKRGINFRKNIFKS